MEMMNKISKQLLILLSVGLISYLTTYNLSTPIQSTVLFSGALIIYAAIILNSTHYTLKTLGKIFKYIFFSGDALDVKKGIKEAVIIFIRNSVSVSLVILMTSIAVAIS